MQISDTSDGQQARVKSIEGLADLLLGIKVRDEILNRVNSCNWFTDFEIQNEIRDKMDDAIIRHTINLLIDIESSAKNEFQVLMKSLRKNKIININNELLKRFVLV